MMTILIVIFGGSLSPSSSTQNLLPRDRWQQQLSHRLCGFLPLSHLRVTFCNLNWEEKTAPKLWTFNWSILWTLHAPKELIYSLQVVCLNVLPYFIPMPSFPHILHLCPLWFSFFSIIDLTFLSKSFSCPEKKIVGSAMILFDFLDNKLSAFPS